MKTVNYFIRKFDRIILSGLVILTAIPIIYLLLLKFEFPIRYIPLSSLHKVIFISGEMLILYFLYRKYFFNGWQNLKIEYLIRDFLILNSVLFLPFFLFYSDRKQSVNEFFKFIRPYLILGYYSLLIITTLVTLFTLEPVKKIRSWLTAGITEQQQKDIIYSQERSKQFNQKFANLSQKRIIGKLAAGAWNEGWLVLLGLLLITAIGLLLRLSHLADLPPYTDETLHLITAKTIATGEVSLQQAPYRRSLLMVTLPVVLFFKIFNVSLLTARIPGIIVNLLALIPLYLLAKKINKPIALLSTGLFAFSPWIIATSQTVREYAYYPFFIYLTGLLMVEFYTGFPDRFILRDDYRKLFSLKNILIIGFLGLNLLYIYADIHAAYKGILVMYPAFGFLLLRKMDWRNPPNILLAVILIVIVSVVIGVLVVKTGEDFHFLRKKMNPFFLLLFYEKPQQQWYFNRPLISFVLMILAFLVVRLFDKKKIVLPLTFLVYGATMLAFSFLRMKTNRPRYATVIEYWHLILIAVGLFLAFWIIKSIIKTKHQWAIWLALILLFWNIPGTLKPLRDFTSGIHPITTEFHADLLPAHTFILSEYKQDEVIVATGFVERFFKFINGINEHNFILYSYVKNNSEKVIYEAIKEHPRGWLILDAVGGYILSKPVPLEDFNYEGVEVKFVGWFGDAYIMRWGE